MDLICALNSLNNWLWKRTTVDYIITISDHVIKRNSLRIVYAIDEYNILYNIIVSLTQSFNVAIYKKK